MTKEKSFIRLSPAVVDLPVDLDVQILPDPVHLDGVPPAVVDLNLRRRNRQLCRGKNYAVSLRFKVFCVRRNETSY